MENWVLVVRANCSDQSMEGHKEFNDWYNNVHVPDIMTIPGFVYAARYENPDISAADTGKYLAIYNIKTDNINNITTAMANNFYKWSKQGRMCDLLRVVSNTFYRQTDSWNK